MFTGFGVHLFAKRDELLRSEGYRNMNVTLHIQIMYFPLKKDTVVPVLNYSSTTP
jgi:hypothetical protein